jgi:hypothetical protein
MSSTCVMVHFILSRLSLIQPSNLALELLHSCRLAVHVLGYEKAYISTRASTESAHAPVICVLIEKEQDIARRVFVQLR